MSGAHRRLQIVHGRVITKRRWRVLRDYKQRRANLPYKAWGDYENNAYVMWVSDFEGFMLRGYGDAAVSPGLHAPTHRRKRRGHGVPRVGVAR